MKEEAKKLQYNEKGQPILPNNEGFFSKVWEIGTNVVPFVFSDRLQPLYDAIANNKVPPSLDLSELEINLEQFKRLGNALSKNSNLISLNLSGIGMSDEDIKPICSALEHHKNLRTLNLSGNLVKDGSSIAKLISKTKGITSLDISHNENMDHSLIFIALSNNKTITHLNIRHNRLDILRENQKKDIKGIEEWEKLNIIMVKNQGRIPHDWGYDEYKKNEELNKNVCNQIIVNNITPIIEILKENNAITSIDLSHTNMGCEGFKLICKTLENNNNITFINVKNNNIKIYDNDDNSFLCNMITNNKVLRRFDFADSQPFDNANSMSYDKSLVNAFNNNTTLLMHETTRLGQRCVNTHLQRNMQAWKESQYVPLTIKRHEHIQCFPEEKVYLFTKENGEPVVLTEKEGKKTFLGVRNGGIKEGRKFVELYENDKGQLIITQSSTAFKVQKFSQYINYLKENEKEKLIKVMCNELSKELSEQSLDNNNQDLMFFMTYSGRPGKAIDSNKLFTQAIEKKYSKEPDPFEAFLKVLEERLLNNIQDTSIQDIFSTVNTHNINNPKRYNEPTPYIYEEIKIEEQEIGEPEIKPIDNNPENNNIIIEEKIEEKQDIDPTDKNPKNNNIISTYREKYYPFDKEKSITIPHTLKVQPICSFCKLDEKEGGFTKGEQVKDLNNKPILFNLGTGRRELQKDTKEISK